MNIFNILISPSFYLHMFNTFLLCVVFILLYNNYERLLNIEPYKMLIVVLLYSISIGVYGISYLGLENAYDFNPIKYVVVKEKKKELEK